MITRHLSKKIVSALGRSPSVLLEGARQTGKTTLVQHLSPAFSKSTYISLDEPLAATLMAQDPVSALSDLPGLIILDEIQLAPELFKSLKVVIDRARTPGRFLLTGSANVLLLPKLSESLAGRMEVYTLYPLSQGEIEGSHESFIELAFGAKQAFQEQMSSTKESSQLSRPELIHRALAGGYPEPVIRKDKTNIDEWFTSYVKTLIFRDIKDLSHIEGLTSLPRLLQLLAHRVGNLINYADISRSLPINQVTLKRYVTLFEKLYLTSSLQPWSTNKGQRLIKTAKLYFLDTGILGHVMRLSAEHLLLDFQLSGTILENFVYCELVKQLSLSSTSPELFHYRTAAGSEVDFVLEGPTRKIVGIEVKAGEQIGKHDLKGLLNLKEDAGKRFQRGFVLYGGKKFMPLGNELYLAPISCLWQTRPNPKALE